MSYNNPSIYEIIETPLISEKLQGQAEKGVYGFSVRTEATKVQIKRAIEKIYNVKVTKVNVMNRQGKSKRLRYKAGRTPDWKKAIVTLKTGHTINLV
jgi:large subunit ribosomal protein L23